MAAEGIRKGFLAEAQAALPMLRDAATKGAGRDGVRRVIGKRFAMYPQPERSDAEWTAFWDDYVAVLGDTPESALEAGMLAWMRQLKSQFLPKPGELLNLAETTPNRAARALERALLAINGPPRHPAAEYNPAPLREEPSDEDKAAVQEMLKSFRANRIPETPKAAMFKFQARTDEHGITPQMRAIMEARR